MYFDFSLKKLFSISLIVLLLIVAVSMTFVLKQALFGSTPFVQAMRYWWNDTSGYFAYSLEVQSKQTGKPQQTNPLLALINSFGGAKALVFNQNAPVAAAVPILTYHQIVDTPDGTNVTLTMFKEQMLELKNAGWQTVSLKDFEEFLHGTKKLPQKSFLVTFDDGAKESFYPVDPLFDVLGFNGVSFIIVHTIEQSGSKYYLSAEEISRMLSSGRWEIGSHSYNGHDSITIDSSGRSGHFFSDKLWVPEKGRLETSGEFVLRISTDLQKSKDALMNYYHVPIDTLAYPFGDYGQGSQNFLSATDTALDESKKIYQTGFYQTHGENFSFNYPDPNAFLAKRISVHPEWSGKDLIAALDRGMPKSLPYEDPLETRSGWISSWGDVGAGGHVLSLAAAKDSTGASALLDGSYLWTNYQFDAQINWHEGFAFLLVAAKNTQNYRACVFNEGKVSLEQQSGTVRVGLGNGEDPNIHIGNNRHIGVVTNGDTISCMWDNRPVLTVAGLANQTGGIGLATWEKSYGKARIEVTKVSVKAL